MPGVTSHDVARRAGVSQSAVSRVFTPGASASQATAEKVRKAAQELGYRPNVIARSLITGRSRIVGLVVAQLDNQFYPGAVEMLCAELKKRSYHLLVFLAPSDDERIEREVAELIDYQVDGLIAASAAMSQQLATRCEERGIPVVLFNRHQGEGGPTSVTSDNFEGGRRIAEFLLSGGHERIAHVSGWSGSSTGREREAGFRSGLAEGGSGLVACADGMYRYETAAKEVRRMFAGPGPAPDAVFAGSDHMAFAAMDVIRNGMGLRIPEDVAVVGYDDVPASAWPAYDLTTVRQPLEPMVRSTVEQLLARIERPESDPVQVRLDGRLVVRGSTRPECSLRRRE